MSPHVMNATPAAPAAPAVQAAQAPHDAPAPAAAPCRALCLVVHDDVELRLRLAGLIRRAVPGLNSDTLTRAALGAAAAERLGKYLAVCFIVEFGSHRGAEPLADVVRVHAAHPRLPLYVFGRGGDERTAVNSMKAGALDYWPIHAVHTGEFGGVLLPWVRRAQEAEAAAVAPDDAREASTVGEAGNASRKTAQPGRQPEIAGYRLIKKLARSNAATVYLALNHELAQPIALKVQTLGESSVLGAAERQRFASECELLASLNHRAIADVLDYGITDEWLYLALEYFPCGSLRERLKNPVSAADAVYYARQIGEALRVVHAAHIVHRDLKPSNVMLRDDNRLALIDFGSAPAGAHATGTPYYASPEQIEGSAPDARSDLYSLGVVLFEMLTGAVPFTGRTVAEIFAAHRGAPVPRLPEHLAHFQRLIERLLAKHPADRVASAAEFIAALDALLSPAPPFTDTTSHSGAPLA